MTVTVQSEYVVPSTNASNVMVVEVLAEIELCAVIEQEPPTVNVPASSLVTSNVGVVDAVYPLEFAI